MRLPTMITVGILSGLIILPQPANAEKTCPWLMKVLAAKDEDFRAFKGAPDTSVWSSPVWFHGTLTLNVTGKALEKGCTLQVRHRGDFDNAPEVGPHYQCSVSFEATPDEASRDFESIAEKLRACMPDLAFSEKRTGDIGDRSATWSLLATANEAQIYLRLHDPAAIAAVLTGTPLDDKPTYSVVLMVISKSALRPDLGIEIPVMK